MLGWQPLVHCAPSEYQAGVVNVGVYGITDAEFSIVAVAGQSSVTLIDGVPEDVETSLYTVCAERDGITGHCLGTVSSWRQVSG